MPRPLPKKSRLNHDISSPMEQRPQLAILIARIATGWSRVEERLGFIIVQLLGAEAHTGMRMFQALSSSAAQKSVLRAVAQDRLDKTMLDQLEGLLSRFKKVGGKRNNIVHGHWYFSDDHPDELVWIDAADEMLGYSQFWAGWSAKQTRAERLAYASKYRSERRNLLLYNQEELESILDEIRTLGSALSSFSALCESLHKPKSDEAGLGAG